MNLRSAIVKYLICVLFLTAYLSVFVVQQDCSNDHLKEAVTSKNSKQDHHSHSHKSSHDHHQHQGNETSKHKHSDKHIHHKGKKEGECCDDKTANFLKSLTNPVVQNYDLKTPSIFVLLLTIDYHFDIVEFSNSTEPYIDYWPPPPKDRNLRVYLNSFII